MEILTQEYERLVDEENSLLEQIETCDSIIQAVIDCVLNGTTLNVSTVDDILGQVQTVKSDLCTELLHLRLEKAVKAGKIKRLSSS